MSLDVSRPLAASLLGLSLVFASCTATNEGSEPKSGSPESKMPAGPAESSSKTGGAQGNQAAGNQGAQADLETQRKNFLIGRALERAKALRESLRLEEAETTLLRALEYDNNNPKVRKMLAEVQEQLGERAGTIENYQQQMARLLELRVQKDRADSRRLIAEAEQAMKDLKYDQAIEKLTQVLLKVEIGKDVDWQDIPDKAKELLAKAKADKTAAEEAAQLAAERETFARLQREEAQRRIRIKARVDTLLGKATKAFKASAFRDALRYAEEALSVNPTHTEARKMVSVAQKALDNSKHDEYILAKAREFKRMLEANEERKIAYTDILTPDAEYWNQVTSKRHVGIENTLGAEKDPATLRVEESLSKILLPKGLSFDADSGGFTEIVDTLNRLSSVPILISPEAKDKIETNSLSLTITLESPLTLKNFLNTMMRRSATVSEEPGDALDYLVQNGAVLITTKNKALGKPVLKIHPIADLTFSMASFAGPQIASIPVGEETDEEKPRQGGEVGERIKFIDPEVLTDMIQRAVARGTWEGEGISIEAAGGNLLVIHTPEVQRRVARFLNDLRKFQTSLVSVESKFLRIDRAELEKFGFDLRGLGGANAKGTVAQLDDVTNGLDDNASRGLDNNGLGTEAGSPFAGVFYDDGLDGDFRGRTENYFTNPLGKILSAQGGATLGFTILDDTQLNIIGQLIHKSLKAQIVNSQTLTVLNGSRASVSVIRQQAYVKDFNVEVANAAFIADPEIDVIQDGIVLDVRPMISYDRKYVTLDLQPTIAELQRPIPTFTTSLAGATLPVTLQFPNMTVRKAETTVKVPDGGSVLIGGLNEVLNRERAAQVPWLAELPIVSLFFQEEGTVDENSSLMVLVRAHITQIDEYMKAGGGR